MSQPEENLRLRRTQKLLRGALIDLIEERGFDALTVGELTSRAMVSRAAFYRNYQDKYDLVEQIFEEVMGTLQGAVANMESEQPPPQVWIKFFEHIAEYERLYRALLGAKGSPWFVRKVRTALAKLVKEHERVPSGQFAADWPILTFSDTFVPDLVSAMLVEAIIWWLEQGRPYTPQEIAMRCARLATEPYHVLVFLVLLYGAMPLSASPVTNATPPKTDRNKEIYQRYVAGERVVDLANEYGVSIQRIYAVVRKKQRLQ